MACAWLARIALALAGSIIVLQAVRVEDAALSVSEEQTCEYQQTVFSCKMMELRELMNYEFCVEIGLSSAPWYHKNVFGKTSSSTGRRCLWSGKANEAGLILS